MDRYTKNQYCYSKTNTNSHYTLNISIFHEFLTYLIHFSKNENTRNKTNQIYLKIYNISNLSQSTLNGIISLRGKRISSLRSHYSFVCALSSRLIDSFMRSISKKGAETKTGIRKKNTRLSLNNETVDVDGLGLVFSEMGKRRWGISPFFCR